jgi:hypothetical protein
MNRMKVTIEHDEERRVGRAFTREDLLVQQRRHREPQLVDPRDAFDYDDKPSTTADLERAVLACAFLLEFNTEGGNEQMDGMVANGLASSLRRCAAEVRKLYTKDDLIAAGGDERLLAPAREAR